MEKNGEGGVLRTSASEPHGTRHPNTVDKCHGTTYTVRRPEKKPLRTPPLPRCVPNTPLCPRPNL